MAHCFKVLQTCLFLSTVTTVITVATVTVVINAKLSRCLTYVLPYCSTTVLNHCFCFFFQLDVTFVSTLLKRTNDSTRMPKQCFNENSMKIYLNNVLLSILGNCRKLDPLTISEAAQNSLFWICLSVL